MFKVGDVSASSLRRLNVLNRILNATNQRSPYGFTRKSYSSEHSNEEKSFVRIGNTTIELKKAKALEKVPRGYLSLYSGVMSDSQSYLKYLRWLMQKDELKQDSFLIGSPPGAFRRNLALSFAELTQREVEYLVLTRDTTEADIKQRREINSGSVMYVNQCAVNAALNGRILIIEGIEKAERNLLPILNNLLENRELNLDDGHFLVSPQRYDKLTDVANESNKDLNKLNLLKVHPDFRVIAIGLPVPKYQGNPLDPPLRSRFQSHLVSLPDYQDFTKYLTSANERINEALINNLSNFGYSFYTNESNSLSLPDFPVENVDYLTRIMNKVYRLDSNQNRIAESYNENFLDTSKLINKLYPFSLILKNEETNQKFFNELMSRFNLPVPKISSNNEANYELVEIKSSSRSEHLKELCFKSLNNPGQLMSIDLIKGNTGVTRTDPNFVMNRYHSSQLVDIMLSHASEHDFCLIGPQGSGKTEIIKQFCNLLEYNMHTIYLYKDMSTRDILQQRITTNNGDTIWHNSPLIDACLSGDIIVLDGIHRLRDDTLMSLRRLIHDRELDLADGSKLIRHDKYDALMKESKAKGIELTSKVMRIDPSFRLIATAEPPATKSTVKDMSDSDKASFIKSGSEWLNSEVLNLFLFQSVDALETQYEHEVLKKKFKLNSQHNQLYKVIEQLRTASSDEAQLNHISKLFSLRKLIRISKQLEQYPNQDLTKQIEEACLFKFMPQLNKQVLSEFLVKNKFDSRNDLPESIEEIEQSLKQKVKKILDFDAENNKALELAEISKIPDTLFFENELHTVILNNMMRDFELGEHILLIGNQGTGKNKLIDKFLMLTKKPREYIQLHRDTTVNSLTVQPIIKSGVVHYEDSPLVKAVKNGYILVVDEADKAPLNVTCILKSIIESSEMILSDGRKIVPWSYYLNNSEVDKSKLIPIHENFRMIIAANRPGFPFLGNDFFAILGDLLACHSVDNPDPQSEIAMLKMYAPNVSEKILNKLVSAFGSLRKLSDQGIISYPYSTRELVNIVKHLEKFPDDSLSSVLTNVSDFDHFAEQSDLKNTFIEVMHKHGIPIGNATFQINLAQQVQMPKVLPIKSNLALKKIDLDGSAITSSHRLEWESFGTFQESKVSKYNLEQKASRIQAFSELSKAWSLNNNQQIITDMLVVRENDSDIVYVSGIKPMSILRTNPSTNDSVEIDLFDYFPQAWRSYYPRLVLLPSEKDKNVMLYEEATNEFFKVDFETHDISKMGRNLIYENSNLADQIVKKAKRTFNRFYTDSKHSYKTVSLTDPENELTIYLNYVTSKGDISLMNVNKNLEINLSLQSILMKDNPHFKLGISQISQFSENSVLVAGFNLNDVTILENLSAKDLVYFTLTYPTDWNGASSPEEIIQMFEMESVNGNLLGYRGDTMLTQNQLKNFKRSKTEENEPKQNEENLNHSNRLNPLVVPTIYNHFVTVPESHNNKLEAYFCRRETPFIEKRPGVTDYTDFKLKTIKPIVKSIMDFENNQLVTQISRYGRPESDNMNLSRHCLGYLELINFDEKVIRYLEVPKPISSNYNHEAWNSYSHLNVTNEAEFLVELSPTKAGNIYTLDFYGNLNEWETSKMKLNRSLDDWQKIIMSRESKDLSIDVFNASPNTEHKEFNGPKHGKVDPDNAPHHGGNTWAGGSGGRDTAGMGGVGGPYRLDSGNKVFQVSDQMKETVPEHVKKAAREMGEKAFRERLREINMSQFEHELYSKYLDKVKKPIQQLRNILDSLEAKKKERQWLKNQTQGDLDDAKLVEAITGEKNVYKRRGDDPNADNSFNIEKPKRLRLVVDVSGSMYRFNGNDNRLEREIESVLMVMESFTGYQDKILYDVIGHSGDGYNIKFVDAKATPKNEAERLKTLKTLIAHSQFCQSGDNTFEATKYAIQQIAKEEADDHFVIVLSDANFDRYGLNPKRFSQIMLDTDPKVNVYCIFIGALGDQAVRLKKNLPSGRTFVCMNTQDIPRIMQQIFQSAMLNQ